MNRPLRPCRHPSCTVLVRGGYCDKHKPKENRSEESKQWHNWYNTKLWKDKLRPAQLMREPFCRECAKHGVRTKAEHVDHIIPFEGELAVVHQLRQFTRAYVLLAMVARQPKKLEKKSERNGYKTENARACACVYTCVCVLSAIYPPPKKKTGIGVQYRRHSSV